MAIIGPNALARTDVLQHGSGRMQPSEGNITLDGKDIHCHHPIKISKLGISRLFSDQQHFS